MDLAYLYRDYYFECLVWAHPFTSDAIDVKILHD